MTRVLMNYHNANGFASRCFDWKMGAKKKAVKTSFFTARREFLKDLVWTVWTGR
jgi:hypothetical protein